MIDGTAIQVIVQIAASQPRQQRIDAGIRIWNPTEESRVGPVLRGINDQVSPKAISYSLEGQIMDKYPCIIHAMANCECFT